MKINEKEEEVEDWKIVGGGVGERGLWCVCWKR